MSFPIPTYRHTAIAAIALALSLAYTSASAQQSDALDRVSISVGDFIVRPHANVGVNTQYGRADSGDISSHDVNVPRIKADFLLGDSQGFSFDYYGFYHKYSDSLNQTVAAGPTDLTVNGHVAANVDLDVANASYKWWLGHGSDVFGVGVGAAYYRIRVGVNGYATTNIDNATGAGNASYSGNAVAPLVQLGWRHAFSKDARLYADVSGIKKNGGNWNGHIYNAAIGAEWYFMKNIGVGAEYSASRVKINNNGENENVDLRLDGPTIFLKARF